LDFVIFKKIHIYQTEVKEKNRYIDSKVMLPTTALYNNIRCDLFVSQFEQLNDDSNTLFLD